MVGSNFNPIEALKVLKGEKKAKRGMRLRVWYEYVRLWVRRHRLEDGDYADLAMSTLTTMQSSEFNDWYRNLTIRST